MNLVHEFDFGMDWFHDEENDRDNFYYDPHPKSLELRRCEDNTLLGYFDTYKDAINHMTQNGYTIS